MRKTRMKKTRMTNRTTRKMMMKTNLMTRTICFDCVSASGGLPGLPHYS